jgi:pentatricopeptide repeat protein
VDAAFEIFDSLQGRGMRPSSRTYNALMGACVRGGQWARAFEVYSTMQLRGAPVGVTTYNRLMQACEAGRDLRKAIAVMVDMRMAGVLPGCAPRPAAPPPRCARG